MTRTQILSDRKVLKTGLNAEGERFPAAKPAIKAVVQSNSILDTLAAILRKA